MSVRIRQCMFTIRKLREVYLEKQSELCTKLGVLLDDSMPDTPPERSQDGAAIVAVTLSEIQGRSVDNNKAEQQWFLLKQNMRRTEYEKKATELLRDENTYAPFDKDPTNTLKNKPIEQLRRWVRLGLMEKRTKSQVYPLPMMCRSSTVCPKSTNLVYP